MNVIDTALFRLILIKNSGGKDRIFYEFESRFFHSLEDLNGTKSKIPAVIPEKHSISPTIKSRKASNEPGLGNSKYFNLLFSKNLYKETSDLNYLVQYQIAPL